MAATGGALSALSSNDTPKEWCWGRLVQLSLLNLAHSSQRPSRSAGALATQALYRPMQGGELRSSLPDARPTANRLVMPPDLSGSLTFVKIAKKKFGDKILAIFRSKKGGLG